ncbi:MAG: ATP-binding protein [Candidatus Aureabacteria bacterium]|nr:ATP-binding protein [Candidatus Auribacterota bacterium]
MKRDSSIMYRCPHCFQFVSLFLISLIFVCAVGYACVSCLAPSSVFSIRSGLSVILRTIAESPSSPMERKLAESMLDEIQPGETAASILVSSASDYNFSENLHERLQITVNMFGHGGVEYWNISRMTQTIIGIISSMMTREWPNPVTQAQLKNEFTALNSRFIDNAGAGSPGYRVLKKTVTEGTIDDREAVKALENLVETFEELYTWYLDNETSFRENFPERYAQWKATLDKALTEMRSLLPFLFVRFTQGKIVRNEEIDLQAMFDRIDRISRDTHDSLHFPRIHYPKDQLRLSNVDQQGFRYAFDQFFMRVAIERLISNIIKLKIDEMWIDVRETDTHIEFVVEDNGDGFRDDSAYLLDIDATTGQQKLFSLGVSETRGSGTGLALARHVIQMMGGTIEAGNSAQYGGARFIIRIPREQDPLANDFIRNMDRAAEMNRGKIRTVRDFFALISPLIHNGRILDNRSVRQRIMRHLTQLELVAGEDVSPVIRSMEEMSGVRFPVQVVSAKLGPVEILSADMKADTLSYREIGIKYGSPPVTRRMASRIGFPFVKYRDLQSGEMTPSAEEMLAERAHEFFYPDDFTAVVFGMDCFINRLYVSRKEMSSFYLGMIEASVSSDYPIQEFMDVINSIRRGTLSRKQKAFCIRLFMNVLKSTGEDVIKSSVEDSQFRENKSYEQHPEDGLRAMKQAWNLKPISEALKVGDGWEVRCPKIAKLVPYDVIQYYRRKFSSGLLAFNTEGRTVIEEETYRRYVSRDETENLVGKPAVQAVETGA